MNDGVIPQQYVLDSQGRSIVIRPGFILSKLDFPFATPELPGDQIGTIVQNPNDPQSLGIQNLSTTPWTCILPNQTSIILQFNEITEIIPSMMITIGQNSIYIRSAIDNPGYIMPQQQVWPPPSNALYGYAYQNDSGSGNTAILPQELRGFNWGALMLTFLWSINMRAWIGLLSLIPYVGFIVHIVAGFKGNEWAWQNRRWESIQQFKDVQKAWTIWGVVMFFIFIGLYAVIFIASGVIGIINALKNA